VSATVRAPGAVRRAGATSVRALHVAVFGFVVLVGALALAVPFWGDQALFAVYGRQLNDGAVLYRDVFDLKQPGIFAFYALGGRVFGFTEVGIHLFELLYWLAFAVFAVGALREHFASRWAAALVPAFTVGVYYLYAQMIDLTQIEALVAFPILAAWWLIDRFAYPGGGQTVAYSAAGALTAAVALGKHLYLLIIVGFLAYALLRARRHGAATRDIARAAAAFSAGLLVPLLLVAAYFGAHGQLERIWWAFVEFPGAARALDPAPLANLTGGARRFMVGHAPWLILALAGAAHALRHHTSPQLPLVHGMLMWLAVGLVTILIQFWGSWHWLLLTVPVGVLAVFGVEALGPRVRRVSKPAARLALTLTFLVAAVASAAVGGAVVEAQKWLLLVAVAVGCAGVAAATGTRAPQRLERSGLLLLGVALSLAAGLALIGPAGKLQALAAHGFATDAEARVAFQRSTNAAYRAADEDLARLQAGEVLPGPLYVFGDPVLLWRAERPQAAAVHGWGPEKLVPRAWQELARDLDASPPPYIIVDDRSAGIIASRYPALLDLLHERYEVAFDGASGTWHIRRGDGGAASALDGAGP
jgi:hypothetical protein